MKMSQTSQMSQASNVSFFSWEIPDLLKKRQDVSNADGLTSTLLKLSSRESVQFELFVVYGSSMKNQGTVRVILKQFNGKPVEASVRLWIEHESGQKFGETFIEKHVFSKIGDFCGYNKFTDAEYDTFAALYQNHDTFTIYCEITDLNSNLFPTVDQYKEFHQNQLASYEQEWHDAVIKVGKTEFKIMKAFLMIQSTVFKTMFSWKFKEGTTGVETKDIKDIEEDTMKYFVKWFYTGELGDPNQVEKLFSAADNYEVKLLKKMCVDRMLSTLDKKNAFNRLILASKHNDTQFKEDILEFISDLPANAFTDFFGSSGWIECCVKHTEIANVVGKLIREKMHKFSSKKMSGRQGGKLKPLKTAKKDDKLLLDEDLEFKKKQQEEKKKMAAAAAEASKKGPMGGAGIKKSGKK